MKSNDVTAAELLQNAISDGRSRNYEAAAKKLRKVLGQTDRLPEALLYLGRACHELGELDEAIMVLRMFITRQPKSNAGYFYLGRTYIAAGKYSRAASCFSEAVKLKPDFVPALAYMGYSLMRIGASVESVDYLRKAVELDTDNPRIYTMYVNSIFVHSLKEFRNENFAASLDALLFLESAGFSSVSTKLYIGIILKEQKKYNDAAVYIQQASELTPDDDLIKNILAELYIKLTKIDDALNLLVTYKNKDEVNEFINAIDNAENSFAASFWIKKDYRAALHFAIASLKKQRTADMHLLAGECLKNTGRLDEAFNHYCRAADIDKKAIEPYYGKAVILWLRKDYQGMLGIIDKINDKYKNDDFASYYRILCSSRLNIPYSDWKYDLEQMLKKDDDPWLQTAKGYGVLANKDYKTAASAFRRALKNQDNLKEAWDGLLNALKESGGRKQLLSALKSYLKIFNDDLENRHMYADLLIENENFVQAAAELRIIISNAEPDITLLKKLAYCGRKSDNYKEAVLIYRQILSNDPHNENYLKMLLYCMRKDGRDKQTIPVLRRAIEELKNPSIDLILVYGVTLYRNHMDEEALNVFQKCIYNGINDWRVYRNMGIIYRSKGLKDWSEMYFRKSEAIKKY